MIDNLQGYSFTTEVAPPQFAHMVDWLLSWRKRDESMNFSVLLIEFVNVADLGDMLGAKLAMALIKRTASEIQDALRNTDMLTRTRVSCFWVLLPNGRPDIVLRKLEPVIAAARADGMDASQLRVRKFVTPDDLENDISTSLDIFMHMQSISK